MEFNIPRLGDTSQYTLTRINGRYLIEYVGGTLYFVNKEQTEILDMCYATERSALVIIEADGYVAQVTTEMKGFRPSAIRLDDYHAFDVKLITQDLTSKPITTVDDMAIGASAELLTPIYSVDHYRRLRIAAAHGSAGDLLISVEEAAAAGFTGSFKATKYTTVIPSWGGDGHLLADHILAAPYFRLRFTNTTLAPGNFSVYVRALGDE